MSILGITILAALCGCVVSGGDPSLTVNLEKFTVMNKENPYFGEWSATLTPGKPENKLSIDAPVKMDIPDTMMVKLDVKVNGQLFPAVEANVCKALLDEVIAKGFVASGNPFPKACPAKKGDYKIVDYLVKKDKLPPGIPVGKFTGGVKFYMPGETPVLSFEFEGGISRNVPGIG